jgi:hypothetical protein
VKRSISNYLTCFTVALVLAVMLGQGAGAITPLPIPDPQPGGFGLEAVKSSFLQS